MSKQISNRTMRRAAEHAARKAAARQAKLQATEQAQAAAAEPQVQPQVMSAAAGAAAPSIPNIDFEPETPRNISEAQLNANRANAQKSTGPVTHEGRAKSSLNAVKTGLTGQTVLLSTDDAEAYQSHLDRHFKRYSPATEEEQTLVQMIADAEWRLLRIPGLEAGIYAIGSRKLADMHPEETDPNAREALIRSEVFLAYRRDLSNLALQERRLRNQQKSDLEKLKALQEERLEKKNEKGKIQVRMLDAIRAMYNFRAFYKTKTFDPAAFGFEFSLAEIEYCDQVLQSAHNNGKTLPSVKDLLDNLRSGQTRSQAA
jgi:hypothetical protein